MSRALKNDVLRLHIEDGLELFSGSDHVAVCVDVKLPSNSEHIDNPKDKGVYLKKDRNVGLAHRIMDRDINAFDWVT